MRIGTTCGRVVWILSLVSVSVGAQAERPYTSIVEGYETVTVADNVYAFIARESESNVVNGNTLAVVGDDGVLVVDTGQIPTLTKRMIADIRRITALPVRYVVNTHFHGDHNVGNSVYRDAFPGVVVIAHENTRRAMHTSMLAFFEKGIAEQLKIGNLLRTRLETGKGRDGAPLTDEMRQLYIRDLADLEPVLEDIQANARFLPPELTFTDRLHIRLGKREVQILYLGRGILTGTRWCMCPTLAFWPQVTLS